MAYNVSNPHPEFGKNPTILNEFGHTAYPKWVETKNCERNSDGTEKKTKDGKPIYERVLVKNEKEEAEVTGKKSKPDGWGKEKTE